jgi:hypothetical protein
VHVLDNDSARNDAKDSDNSEFWSGVPDRRRRRPSPASKAAAASATPRAAAHPAAAASRRARAARTLSSRDTGAHREITRDITRPVPRVASATAEHSVVREHHGRSRRHPNQSLRRAGVLGVTVLLLVPVAMALRAEAEGPRQVAPLATSASTVAPTVAQADALAAADASAKVAIEALQPIVPEPDDPGSTAAAQQVAAAAKVAPTTATKTTKPTKTATKKVAAAPCVPYTVKSGDAWITIAHRASVSLRSLLTVNRARTTTALMPGRAICLPAGATMPTAATKPASKSTPTTVKASTATTKATPPTTTQPELVAPPNTYTRDEIAQIIRDVWPDDLEDHAIAIADRESHLNPSARNFCCYGLFQIYFSVHRTWLATLGVTSPAQLWDPRVSVLVAYQMYLRSGFAPWGG